MGVPRAGLVAFCLLQCGFGVVSVGYAKFHLIFEWARAGLSLRFFQIYDAAPRSTSDAVSAAFAAFCLVVCGLGVVSVGLITF